MKKDLQMIYNKRSESWKSAEDRLFGVSSGYGYVTCADHTYSIVNGRLIMIKKMTLMEKWEKDTREKYSL